MNNPLIGIPVILMFFGLVVWLTLVCADASEPIEKRQTKKGMLVNLLLLLVWPLSLLGWGVYEFYKYWKSIEDE